MAQTLKSSTWENTSDRSDLWFSSHHTSIPKIGRGPPPPPLPTTTTQNTQTGCLGVPYTDCGL